MFTLFLFFIKYARFLLGDVFHKCSWRPLKNELVFVNQIQNLLQVFYVAIRKYILKVIMRYYQHILELVRFILLFGKSLLKQLEVTICAN